MSIVSRQVLNQDIKIFGIGEFTDCKIIGEGGFGFVKSAEWKKYGMVVALKSLKAQLLDEKATKQFVREVS